MIDININLQFFADAEKTEEPTPKKRRDAREEGQVLQSREVTAVFILLASFLLFRLYGKYLINTLADYITNVYTTIGDIDPYFYESNLMIGASKNMALFFILTLPILGVAFISALAINYLQVGFLFTTKTLKMDLNRINPLEGFKRIFSKRALMELLKSSLKIVLITYIGYSFIKNNLVKIMELPRLETTIILKNFSSLGFQFAIRIVIALIVIAAMDYFFQWRQHEKNLMMTKHEIKEEFKQTEGDPLIKSKIREKQRRMAMSRMMQDVPKADVIITNPTHIAIAIKYDMDSFEAPYVLAKGVDLVAENIRSIGRENSIPIVENKILARTLYETVEIGEMIPEELYEAVAEVLAYVYSLKEDY